MALKSDFRSVLDASAGWGVEDSREQGYRTTSCPPGAPCLTLLPALVWKGVKLEGRTWLRGVAVAQGLSQSNHTREGKGWHPEGLGRRRLQRECGTSPVVQRLRNLLPTQRTRILALVWEDSTCSWAAKPLWRNYSTHPRACAQQETPLQWEARTLQLEKARAQQRRPRAGKMKKRGNVESQERGKSLGSPPPVCLRPMDGVAICWDRKPSAEWQVLEGHWWVLWAVVLRAGLQGAAGRMIKWEDRQVVEEPEVVCCLCAPREAQRELGWTWQTLPIAYPTAFLLLC